MDNEFDSDPGVQADNWGQAEDSGSQSQDTRRPINLDELPEGRALKSKLQRETAAERARAERAERELARLRSVIDTNDPEIGQRLILEAQRDELNQYRAAQAEQQRQQEIRNYHEGVAADLGVDIYDPTFQAALARTITESDPRYVERAKIELVGRRQSQQSQRQIREEPDYALPPTGGASRPPKLSDREKEDLHAKLNSLYRDYSRNKPQIENIKRRLEL